MFLIVLFQGRLEFTWICCSQAIAQSPGFKFGKRHITRTFHSNYFKRWFTAANQNWMASKEKRYYVWWGLRRIWCQLVLIIGSLGWKCRYFEVFPGRIEYFSDQYSMQPRGSISLSNAIIHPVKPIKVKRVKDYSGIVIETRNPEKVIKLASERTGLDGFVDANTWHQVCYWSLSCLLFIRRKTERYGVVSFRDTRFFRLQLVRRARRTRWPRHNQIPSFQLVLLLFEHMQPFLFRVIRKMLSEQSKSCCTLFASCWRLLPYTIFICSKLGSILSSILPLMWCLQSFLSYLYKNS